MSQLFKSVAPDDGSQRARIRFMERNTVLPVKAVYFLVLIFYLYFNEWPEMDADRVRWTLLRTIQWFFVFCLIVNVIIGVMLIRMEEFSTRVLREVVLMLLEVIWMLWGLVWVLWAPMRVPWEAIWVLWERTCVLLELMMWVL